MIQKPIMPKKIHLLGFRGSDSCLLVISYNYHETFTSMSCLDLLPDAMIRCHDKTLSGANLDGRGLIWLPVQLSVLECSWGGVQAETLKEHCWRGLLSKVSSACFFLHPRTVCLGWHYPMWAGPPTSVINQENAHRYGQRPSWWRQFLS